MALLVLVTEDDAFAAAAAALASDDLMVIRATVEETAAVARRDHPDVLAIDTDSIREAGPLIGALSLVTGAAIVAVSHHAWPGSEQAAAWRAAGADAVLPKPSGSAAPTLAGADRDAYARWFCDLVRTRQETPA
jgi:chemotaxis response regulator CheB